MAGPLPAQQVPAARDAVPSAGAAVRRLSDFATRAYGRDRHKLLRTLLYPTDPTVLELLIETYQAAGVVGPRPRNIQDGEPMHQYVSEVAEPYLAEVRDAYLRDLEVLTPLAERFGFFEAIRRLNANEATRVVLEFEMLFPAELRALHEGARAYLVKRSRALHGIPRQTAGFTNQEYLAIDRAVREEIISDALKLIAAHPDRENLIRRLGISIEQAELAIRSVFAEIKSAIDEFGDDLEADQQQVWRYPPVLVGAARRILAEAGLLSGAQPFGAYLTNLADEKSFDAVEFVSFAVGVAVVAVTTVVVPGGGLIVAALEGLDASLATYGAVRAFRRENEIALANVAEVLGRGDDLAPRQAQFGGVALAAWAALLTTAGFLGVLRRVAAGRRALRGADEAGAGITSGAPKASERAVDQEARGLTGGKAEGATEVSSADRAAAAKRSAEVTRETRQTQRRARAGRGAVRATRVRRGTQRRVAGMQGERAVHNPLGRELTETEIIQELESEPGTLADDPLRTRSQAARMAPLEREEVVRIVDDLVQATPDPRQALEIVRARYGNTAQAHDIVEEILVRQPEYRGIAPLGEGPAADFQRLVTGRDAELVFDLPDPVGITAAGRPRTEVRIDGFDADHLLDAKFTQGDIERSRHLPLRRRPPPRVERPRTPVDQDIVQAAQLAEEPFDQAKLQQTIDQMHRQMLLAERKGFRGVKWVCATEDLARFFDQVFRESGLGDLFRLEFVTEVFGPGVLIR